MRSLPVLDKLVLCRKYPSAIAASSTPMTPTSSVPYIRWGLTVTPCIDFRENPNAEPAELWEPEGANYYNGELIVQPQQRWTQQQQLELLDTHPIALLCLW